MTQFGPIANIGEAGILSVLIILVLIIWTFIWKGLALWCAARNNHRAWFIALLLINTLGILEIIYYFFFRKENSVGQKVSKEYFPEKKSEDDIKEAL